ncbi:MAG: sugar phosphate isomerase/epimerase [Candidatus Cloacimonetes bacterium]|nr:sugar phosphate isomerase/epimerase [Candidatus Cloacimonadota bacterium]MCK9333023.1 sugar phosphate isomerase/epimerase [Candidatus Cloacimonadota bacterium]MDD3379320.1 sugar phosphate isomerase/epimerase [Candidatus Methanomethylophilaceae archaeon]
MIGVSCPDFCSHNFVEIWNAVSENFKHWEIFSEANHALPTNTGLFLGFRDDHKDMTYSIHAPIADINLASLNERIREASFMEIYSTMESAKEMGIKTITIHPGIYSFAVGGMKERSIANAKLTLKMLAHSARSVGDITLAVENMPSFPIMMGQTPDELGELVDGTDLSICFDIGHANTMNCINEFIDRFKDRLANVHIHDNMGDRDAHLGLGEGNIDFEAVLSKLKGYTGNYIIESKSLESAIRSKVVLEKLIN